MHNSSSAVKCLENQLFVYRLVTLAPGKTAHPAKEIPADRRQPAEGRVAQKVVQAESGSQDRFVYAAAGVFHDHLVTVGDIGIALGKA